MGRSKGRPVTETPKRPWRKKWWQAAALTLWLVAAYPLSAGPAVYAVMRGWLPGQTFQAVYGPVWRCRRLRPVDHYLCWWLARGYSHRENGFGWTPAEGDPL